MIKVKKSVLNCKRIETAISNATRELIHHCMVYGIYENFGQEYVSAIRDKFTKPFEYNYSLECFNNWCMTYNGKVGF